ncbi:hypothetical protein AVEN_176828-1, partial [Araneus ventricosus]
TDCVLKPTLIIRSYQPPQWIFGEIVTSRNCHQVTPRPPQRTLVKSCTGSRKFCHQVTPGLHSGSLVKSCTEVEILSSGHTRPPQRIFGEIVYRSRTFVIMSLRSFGNNESDIQ